MKSSILIQARLKKEKGTSFGRGKTVDLQARGQALVFYTAGLVKSSKKGRMCGKRQAGREGK